MLCFKIIDFSEVSGGWERQMEMRKMKMKILLAECAILILLFSVLMNVFGDFFGGFEN